METRNQLWGHHQDQETHYQPVLNNDLLGSAATQEEYVPRLMVVTSNGLVPQNNIGNYGIAGERNNLEQCISPEQYTGSGHHNAVASSYSPELPPYHHVHSGPDLSSAFGQRPAFIDHHYPIDDENFGQPLGGEDHADYTSPGATEGSAMPSEHLARDSPDGEVPQELSFIDEQVLSDEDIGVDHEDEDGDDEDDGVDHEDEDGDDEDDGVDHEVEGVDDGDGCVTDDEGSYLGAFEAEADTDKCIASHPEDSIQVDNPAPKRKRTYLLPYT